MWHGKPNFVRSFVCLGSNLGDRAAYLLLGVRGMMDAHLGVCRLSPIYETEPVGVQDQPPFLNMVAELHVQNFIARQVLARLLRVEYAAGRRRDGITGPRTLDLDLLFFGAETHATEFLQVPHPRLHERRFVLTPLFDLDPLLRHPVTKQTVAEMLAAVPDTSLVKRWKPAGHGAPRGVGA
jgi:2-amino-4-hydroxy-6-hydroxymethyldihydropteridine diphosphokinase